MQIGRIDPASPLGEASGSPMATLTDTIYAEVRRIAAPQLRHERPDHSLRPTELAHEVLARLLASNAAVGIGREKLLRRVARHCRGNRGQAPTPGGPNRRDPKAGTPRPSTQTSLAPPVGD
ncbi:MAG: ECF-type sigma factor [Phycisphaerales bacterium]